MLGHRATLRLLFASTAVAIRRTRSGSVMASISTILPPLTVNPVTAKGRPLTVTTTPGAPVDQGRSQLRGGHGRPAGLAGDRRRATYHR